MIVITSGNTYIDIDALACSLAYQNFLCKNKFDDVPVEICHSGSFNKTIPYWFKREKFLIYDHRRYQNIATNNKYIIVDVSDPKYFESFISEKDIAEIFDHHLGFEDFWNSRPHIKTKIEKIGACATLIWERMAANPSCLQKDISELLYLAIISNTLNFGAQITHSRDISAANEISSIYDLDTKNLIFNYYKNNDLTIYKNIIESLKTDKKTVSIKGQPLSIFQLELYNSDHFFKDVITNQSVVGLIKQTSFSFLNLIDISRKKSFFIINDQKILQMISREFLITEIAPSIFVLNYCVLRKEIIHALQGLS